MPITHSLSSLKALIVDDHFLTRDVLRDILQDCNVTQIHTAPDGPEAIDRIQTAYDAGRPYDIVFLDWNIPTISGFDVLTHFRAKPEYANTAFVMFTAESEQQNIVKAIKAGATSYITKPASTSELSRKLSDILHWLQSQPSRKG